jgi:hypothetical protein
MRADQKSFAHCARVLKVSRSAAIGKHYRLTGHKDTRTWAQKTQRVSKYVERWADRKARLAKERAARA